MAVLHFVRVQRTPTFDIALSGENIDALNSTVVDFVPPIEVTDLMFSSVQLNLACSIWNGESHNGANDSGNSDGSACVPFEETFLK